MFLCLMFSNFIYPKEPIGIKYKLYLKDISELNEPTGFIKNSPNNLLDKMKKSSVFDKIWTKYSATYYKDDSYEIQAKPTWKILRMIQQKLRKIFILPIQKEHM